MKGIFESLTHHARKERRRVAIGAHRITTGLLAGLENASQVADVVIVGSEAPGYECVPVRAEEEIADELIALGVSGQVDAVVRGQVYYTDYHTSLKRQLQYHRDLMCPYLLKDARENEWFITPVVHHDDASVNGRCYLASQAALICRALGVQPVIGVLAADNERSYLPSVDQSLDDAEAIVTSLKARGLEHSRAYPLRIDAAATESVIVVPMDGTLGNFVYRALGYLGGASLVGGFSLTPRLVSIDTSRYNDRFAPAIEAAVAMANLGGMPVSEYAD